MPTTMERPTAATIAGLPPSVRAIQDEIRRHAKLPLKQAITLPREAYMDPDYYQWEVDHLMKADWMCIAHVSQVPHPGDYLNVDLLGEPLVVVRGKDQAVRVLSRVCPHRGMDILPKEYGRAQQGNTRLFICPYHTWTFELDGKVKGCPEMHLAEDFNRGDYGLGSVRAELWEGFIFVNLEGKAKPLSEQYADLQPFVAPWRMGEMQVVIEDAWDCPFNWKVLLENWIESYHHMGAHARTLQPMMPAKGTWTEPQHPHFVHCHLPYKQSLVDELNDAIARNAERELGGFNPIAGLPHEHKREWHLFAGYPCFGFLLTRDRAIWYRFIPTGPTSMKLTTSTLCHKDNLERDDWEALRAAERKMAVDFHTEDMEVLIAMQRGIESGHYVRGRLSHLEEPIWLFQRYLAARFDGAYPEKLDRTGLEMDGTSRERAAS